MDAETAYLFRHALVRDAAYSLQLPGDRARLHELAFHVIEQAFGGRAPEPPPLDTPELALLAPHPTDGAAMELAEHLQFAVAHSDSTCRELAGVRRLYLQRAAMAAQQAYRHEAARRAWETLLPLLDGPRRADCMLQIALALRDMGNARQALEWLARAGGEPGALPRLRGALHGAVATASNDLGMAAEAERNYLLAIEDARASGDISRLAKLFNNLATAYREMGRVAEAQQLLEQALNMVEQQGAKLAPASIWANLALVQRGLGQGRRRSIEFLEKALAGHRAAGNRRGEAIALGNLAIEFQELGDFDTAEAHYARALELHRQVGNRRSEANGLGNLATLLAAQGREEEARNLTLQALDMHRETGARRPEGIVLTNLGNRAYAMNDYKAAKEHFRAALAISREVHDRAGEGICIGALGGIRALEGDLHGGIRELEEALAIHREVRNHEYCGTHLCTLADLFVEAGRVEDAQRAWREGVALLRVHGSAGVLERRIPSMREACVKAGIPPLDE
ncbi:MAG: tetratricopeptide repeat protein [Planctomycetes bacterium]|nr:tetratricopeptide repeat protein [Planctomycetota bacterium]